jgi:hypothetical protein
MLGQPLEIRQNPPLDVVEISPTASNHDIQAAVVRVKFRWGIDFGGRFVDWEPLHLFQNKFRLP